MREYTIKVNEEQLWVLEEALEVLARMGTKQYAMVLDHVEVLGDDRFGMLSYNDRNMLQQKIREAEGCDMPYNASFGIYSEEISDKFRVAWDIYQVLRFTRSWANAKHEPAEMG